MVDGLRLLVDVPPLSTNMSSSTKGRKHRSGFERVLEEGTRTCIAFDGLDWFYANVLDCGWLAGTCLGCGARVRQPHECHED